MTIKNIFCLVFASCFLILNATSSSILSNPTLNIQNLRKLFEAVKPYSDLSNAFYSIKGLELLGDKLAPQSHQEICNFIKSKVDKNSLESIYYATTLVALVPNCPLPIAEFQAALTSGASSANLLDLYYYSFANKNLKQPIDAKKLVKSVIDGLKTDSSIINQAYSLHIASLLGEEGKVFYNNIEDILDQADEVDKKFLQYEGGVGTTSLVLEGILVLSEQFNQLTPKLDQQRLSKFVNYLTSKRFPTNIKSAFFLLRNALKLSNNKFSVPLILNRISSASVSASSPNVVVSLTNVLGGAAGQFNLEAESAKSQKPNGPSLLSSKRAFSQKSSDGTTYELKLVDQNQQVVADFYQLNVNAVQKQGDKKFFLVQNKVEVKISTTVSIVDVQLGVADRDQSVPKLVRIEEKSKLKDKLDADQQSKLYLKFSIRDKIRNTAFEPHQAFVRFSEAKSGREIVFLAQAGLNNIYSAEIDFSSNAKNFRHTSGLYSVDLVVADALIENPVSWNIADLKIQFMDDQSVISQEKASIYSKRPEIQHLFRLAEKTPPVIVSTVFGLICLVPLGLLIVLWFGIGFNLRGFSFSLSSFIFHIALGSIFALFYCYWLKLNMFQTARYLAILGIVAFIAGNRLLRNLANKEKKN